MTGRSPSLGRRRAHRVRSSAELLRDDLMSSTDVSRVVSGFGVGSALPGEGAWSTAGAGAVSQTDAEASHAKFAIRNVAQPRVATLYGVTARADGGARAGYGLHFLASGTPSSGNTWNYGHSYLIWATQEAGFYDSDETQVQLYESLDGNRLVWRKSRNLAQPLSVRAHVGGSLRPRRLSGDDGRLPLPRIDHGAGERRGAIQGHGFVGHRGADRGRGCAARPRGGRWSLPTCTCCHAERRQRAARPLPKGRSGMHPPRARDTGSGGAAAVRFRGLVAATERYRDRCSPGRSTRRWGRGTRANWSGSPVPSSIRICAPTSRT